MKTVIKYGIICGIILAAGLKFLSDNHFPTFVLTIVLYPGGMMFTVNEYLMDVQNRQKYSYLFGVLLSASFAVLSLFICMLIWLPILYDFDIVSAFKAFAISLQVSAPFLLMCAFGVPLMYLRNEKPNKEDKEDYRPDILDEEL